VFCCARFDSVCEDSKGDFVAQGPDRCHDEVVDMVNVGKEEEEPSERTSYRCRRLARIDSTKLVKFQSRRARPPPS
jgi:hypothetical protein